MFSLLLHYATELIAVNGIICLLIFAILNSKRWRTSCFVELMYKTCILILFTILFTLIVNELRWYNLHTEELYYSNSRFNSNLLQVIIKIFIVSLSICCLSLYTVFFTTANTEHIWEYPIFILLATLGMLVMISSNDLILAYITLELQSILLYILVGLRRYSNLSVEATLKYFINAAFCSAIMLFGISLFYGQLGTTNFIEIHILAANMQTNYIVLLAGLMLLSGFLFKFAMVPFYFWIADVFQGSAGYFGSYIAIVTKFPVLILFIKVYFYILINLMYFTILIKWLCIISVVISSVYALNEYSFKRFWALTSISHSAYIVLALTLNDYKGISIAILYMSIYLISSLGIWIIVLRIFKQPSKDFTLLELFNKLPRFSSLKSTQMLYSISLAFLILSIAGIPPAAGFLPKLSIYWQLYLLQDFLTIFVLFFIQLVSIAYYIRLIRFLLFNTPRDESIIEASTLAHKFETFLYTNIVLINFLFIYYYADLFLILDFVSQNFLN